VVSAIQPRLRPPPARLVGVSARSGPRSARTIRPALLRISPIVAEVAVREVDAVTPSAHETTACSISEAQDVVGCEFVDGLSRIDALRDRGRRNALCSASPTSKGSADRSRWGVRAEGDGRRTDRAVRKRDEVPFDRSDARREHRACEVRVVISITCSDQEHLAGFARNPAEAEVGRCRVIFPHKQARCASAFTGTRARRERAQHMASIMFRE